MLFMVQKRSKNGSRLYGEAIREGISPVYGSFKEVINAPNIRLCVAYNASCFSLVDSSSRVADI